LGNLSLPVKFLHHFKHQNQKYFVSLPKLKAQAQVSFSGHPLFIVHQSENFLHFQLLLQNHTANFNHTWHKSSLGEGIQI
jgi:hypothetical protein